MDEIKILSTSIYRDGGTISIKTNLGEFCIDGRIGSDTKGKMFSGYPENSEETKGALAHKILKQIIWKNGKG